MSISFCPVQQPLTVATTHSFDSPVLSLRMLSSTSHFVALLGLSLGASLVTAIPKANYLIVSPPETVTVTTCGYQCASTVTVTETLTETVPYFFTCEPSSTSVATGPLGSLTLSSSIIPPPPFTLSNTTSRVSPTPTSWATGPVTSVTLPSSTKVNTETSTPGVTVSSQLPSVRTPSSSFTWSVNSTSS
ncbi:hypothetical protein LY78DRAFT_124352 [Colletotrichum sublineola]|nr:hypothetical protein LY78DRAFT_124352 [Colletotrichum sublineola]